MAERADLRCNVVQSGRSPIRAFDRDFLLTAFNTAHSDENLLTGIGGDLELLEARVA